MIFGREELLFPGIAIAPGLFGRGAVVGELMRANAGQQLRASPDVVNALSEKSAHRPQLGGINVTGRNEIGAQQVRDLLAIDAVVLVLPAVDRLEVESVCQDKGQARR